MLRRVTLALSLALAVGRFNDNKTVWGQDDDQIVVTIKADCDMATTHVNVLAEGLDMPRDALTTATSHFLTDQAKDVLKTLDRDARDAVNALICDLAEDAVSRFAPGAS